MSEVAFSIKTHLEGWPSWCVFV